MKQEIIKKSAWVLVDITESNCGIISSYAKQRSKELDEVANRFPNKMWRYVYRLWTKEEKVVFFKTLLEEYGMIKYNRNSNWSSNGGLVIYNSSLFRVYKEYDIFNIATPTDKWIENSEQWYCLYNTPYHFAGVIVNNVEALLLIYKMAEECPHSKPIPGYYTVHAGAFGDKYGKEVTAKIEKGNKYIKDKWDNFVEMLKTKEMMEISHA